MTIYDQARQLIDAAHSADPKTTPIGQPAELLYADRMEEWVTRLNPQASPLLRLAARCQHLERWVVPRDTFPLDRPGYHAWRKSLYRLQSERARELLLQAGLSTCEADDVALWVSKTGLKTNPDTQALEDAAVLVFLENEIAGFAAQHAHYPPEKFVGILRKTWSKLSPDGQQAARQLDLVPEIASLLQQALAEKTEK